jgi:hypothetical protein
MLFHHDVSGLLQAKAMESERMRQNKSFLLYIDFLRHFVIVMKSDYHSIFLYHYIFEI